MNKKELFEKYNIDESHNAWSNSIDNWMSVEIYRIMHDGNLPPQEPKDMTVLWCKKKANKISGKKEFYLSIYKHDFDFNVKNGVYLPL